MLNPLMVIVFIITFVIYLFRKINDKNLTTQTHEGLSTFYVCIFNQVSRYFEQNTLNKNAESKGVRKGVFLLQRHARILGAFFDSFGKFSNSFFNFCEQEHAYYRHYILRRTHRQTEKQMDVDKCIVKLTLVKNIHSLQDF